MAAVLDRGSLSKSAQLADEEYTLQSDLLERLSESDAKTCAKLTKVLLANQRNNSENMINGYRDQLTSETKINEELKSKVNALARIQSECEAKLKLVQAETSKVHQLQRRLEVCEAHNGTLQSEKAGLTRELSSAQTQIKKLYKELQARKAQIRACRQMKPPMASITPSDLWEERSANTGTGSRPNVITVMAPVIPKDHVKRGDVHTPPSRKGPLMADASVEVIPSSDAPPPSQVPVPSKQSDKPPVVADEPKPRRTERKVSQKSTISKKTNTKAGGKAETGRKGK